MFYALSVLKMFRKEIINRYHIKFKTDAKTAEDQLFTVTFMMHARHYAIKTDYPYYVVVNDFQSGQHLSTQQSTGKQYFSTIQEIYREIYQSPVYKNQDTRDRLAGKYTTRLLRHGQKKHFANSTMSHDDKTAWLKHFSKTVNNIPRSADQYVTQTFQLKLEAIRQNNLLAVMIAIADKLL